MRLVKLAPRPLDPAAPKWLELATALVEVPDEEHEAFGQRPTRLCALSYERFKVEKYLEFWEKYQRVYEALSLSRVGSQSVVERHRTCSL